MCPSTSKAALGLRLLTSVVGSAAWLGPPQNKNSISMTSPLLPSIMISTSLPRYDRGAAHAAGLSGGTATPRAGTRRGSRRLCGARWYPAHTPSPMLVRVPCAPSPLPVLCPALPPLPCRLAPYCCVLEPVPSGENTWTFIASASSPNRT